MMVNPVKEKLRRGGIAYGAWLNIASPAVAEIMALAGFDFLVVDTEHGAISVESVQALLQAMSGTEVVPLVRLGGYQQGTVNQILDTGPRGVVVPMVNSRMETEGAVSAVLYPPSGTRGIGLGRAHSYDPETRNEYLGSANATMLIVIQIEHQSAVARIEEIVSVQGIDVVFLGLVDLAGSLGHPGHTSHPDVARAVEKVVSVTREAGLTLGIAVNGKDELAARIKQGFRFFHLGADIAYLAQASKQRVREARAILDSPLIPQLTGQ